ncbi:hypothetical protein CAOG_00383 [Capsaspora owczarzaki ATCC 30864]|uniref:Saposin B-type domain-containing protein n=1 Tax=Capsaspora owczarzaki (strain ATCC 30864) TaxID=595528 RepID=A0A0D2WH08_CAPO3|nr:hypothetical protein CAOG_00383 [Capsaspora owczarzaki ATCC 30864]KJE88800.1 hypothetical protein CAOG_000383 [Capsaspora owczarzaki ATCC 30864]|eukprot:XP_004365254.1 hypothetical protein CAOG_00383 [Capsaspora owczarzaki ATCC 30864]
MGAAGLNWPTAGLLLLLVLGGALAQSSSATPITTTTTTTDAQNVDVSPLGASITFQVHSANDVREWPQLIRKGTDMFKIDGHHTPPHVCATQQSVVSRGLDPRGCLLLVHDPPSRLYPYFSSYDVVDFLNDPAIRPLLTQPDRTITLYTDWKFDSDNYPFVNPAVVDSLRNEFIANLSRTITTNQLNMKLLTEGYGGLAATYCPSAADITNQASCYNTDVNCQQYAVLNCEANPIPFDPVNKNVDSLCPTKFGKFINSTWPWVYWEPTDQPSIFKVLDAYVSCGVEHDATFRIAINSDPLHYEVFAASRSGKAWNAHLAAQPSISASRLLTAPLASNANVPDLVAVFSVGTADTGLVHRYQVTRSTTVFGAVAPAPVLGLAGATALSTPIAAAGISAQASGPSQQPVAIVLDAVGNYVVYVYSSADLGSLALLGNGSFSPYVPLKASLDVTVLNASQTSITILHTFVPSAPLSSGPCPAYLALWEISLASPSAPVALGTPTCVSSAALTITKASVAAAEQVLPYLVYPCTTTDAYAGFATFSTDKNTIHGAPICINLVKMTVQICLPLPGATSLQCHGLSSAPLGAAPQLDVGTAPSVAMQFVNGTAMLLEVHQDGFCTNCDWHNKRAYPQLCDVVQESYSGVLAANYGRYSAFVAQVASATASNPGQALISACHASITHAAFDQGSSPSVAMYAHADGSGLAMAEVHVGFPTGAVDYNGCGFPTEYDGLVLDAFALTAMRGGANTDDDDDDDDASLENAAAVDQFYAKMSSNLGVLPVDKPAEPLPTASECEICLQSMQDLYDVQIHDYVEIQASIDDVVKTCPESRVIIGGTLWMCQNIVLLYGDELAVEGLQVAFSPLNCNKTGVCSSQSSALTSPPPLAAHASALRNMVLALHSIRDSSTIQQRLDLFKASPAMAELALNAVTSSPAAESDRFPGRVLRSWMFKQGLAAAFGVL